MRIKPVALFILFVVSNGLIVTTSCNYVQKIIDPVKKARKEILTIRYEKDGLSFTYPDNWRITEDAPSENGIRHVIIEDSDSSLFILDIMSSEFEVDLEEHATTFMKDLPPKMPIGKISDVKSGQTKRMISNESYDGVRRTYSVSVLGEVVPHTIDFFLIAGETSTALVTIQAADEDWKAAEKEIQIISESLNIE